VTPRAATYAIGDEPLAVPDVVAIANGARAELGTGARVRMQAARDLVEELVRRDAAVYGLTTGVGAQKRHHVDAAEQAQFNRLMIEAHALGYGDPAPRTWVRAAIAVRAAGLAQGHAGVRPQLVDTMLAALDADAIPQVHLVGSIGQSDLAPLAEISRALIGTGPEAGLLRSHGVEPIELAAREALALINHNAFSTGIAALALAAADRSVTAAGRAAALTYEGMLGNVAGLDPLVAAIRPMPQLGALITELRELLAGGALLAGRTPPRVLQDPLCLRVVPQTHAACRQALEHARVVIDAELASAADNPIVDAGSGRSFSAGNHDITPVAIAIDYARLGLAQVATTACERVQRLLDPAFTDLPSGLRATDETPQDGLQILANGAAALAAEIRLAAQPVTTEQPTSHIAEGIEDRITMAPAGARRLHDQARFLLRLAAVEAVCAAQAVDLRRRLHELGPAMAELHGAVRASVPFTQVGSAPQHDVEALATWLGEDDLG
jgi:histidine ammonia-lyase